MRWNLPSRLGRVFLFPPPPSLRLCLSASLLSSFGTAIDSCCWESDTQGFGRAMEHEASSGILLRVSDCLSLCRRTACSLPLHLRTNRAEGARHNVQQRHNRALGSLHIVAAQLQQIINSSMLSGVPASLRLFLFWPAVTSVHKSPRLDLPVV